MRREIRIAGFGGQGVITLGTIVAVAAGIHEDLEVAQTQSYGPEARGGACRSDVVISNEPIDYPKPLSLDLFVALSQSGLDRYWAEVREGKTLVLVDQTLVTKVPEHNPPVLGMRGDPHGRRRVQRAGGGQYASPRISGGSVRVDRLCVVREGAEAAVEPEIAAGQSGGSETGI